MRFLKYHALDNDYIVLHPQSFQPLLSQELVRLICHRNYGIGSDGILYGPVNSKSCLLMFENLLRVNGYPCLEAVLPQHSFVCDSILDGPQVFYRHLPAGHVILLNFLPTSSASLSLFPFCVVRKSTSMTSFFAKEISRGSKKHSLFQGLTLTGTPSN